MSYARQYGGGGPGGGRPGGFGLTGPVPRDMWILLGIVFVTFSLGFFASTAPLVSLLRLTPDVWGRGFAWQIVTYAFVGLGNAGIWFLIELLIIFLFGRDVLYRLGRRGFWRLLISVAAIAGVAAVAVQLGVSLVAGATHPAAFSLMQGQRMVLSILIAAFAVLNRHATILLFFVLPIQARWFLFLEIIFAFLGFLSTRDLAGFLGICAAVAATVVLLGQGGGGGGGLRELWLRAQERYMRFRLDRLRKKRGFRVVDGNKKSDPWVH